jgi:WhiB family redox-sensing transcriptional regulator
MSEALEVEEGLEDPSPIKYASPEKDHELESPDVSWHAYASCKGLEAKVFFGDGKVGGSKMRSAGKREAIRICKGCPVRIQCLKYAVFNNMEYGIWGGYDMRELKGSGRKSLAKRIK